MQLAAIGFSYYHQRMPFSWNRTLRFKEERNLPDNFKHSTANIRAAKQTRSGPPGSVKDFETRNDTAHRIRSEDLNPEARCAHPPVEIAIVQGSQRYAV